MSISRSKDPHRAQRGKLPFEEPGSMPVIATEPAPPARRSKDPAARTSGTELPANGIASPASPYGRKI